MAGDGFSFSKVCCNLLPSSQLALIFDRLTNKLLIKGIPCVITGILIFFILPNSTDTAYFLTEQEKMMCAARRNQEFGQTEKAQKFSRKDALKALKDWKVYAFAFAHFGILNMLYGQHKISSGMTVVFTNN